jgi:hypothetical protein
LLLNLFLPPLDDERRGEYVSSAFESVLAILALPSFFCALVNNRGSSSSSDKPSSIGAAGSGSGASAWDVFVSSAIAESNNVGRASLPASESSGAKDSSGANSDISVTLKLGPSFRKEIFFCFARIHKELFNFLNMERA